ncbi:helix-turn-helix domain-containing protein [Hyphomonas sp.]|uniref:AraC family transcriptional regulator n=1 Tax=Hyphomonas sp. TaxID=87 RepID=UPI003F6F9DB5
MIQEWRKAWSRASFPTSRAASRRLSGRAAFRAQPAIASQAACIGEVYQLRVELLRGLCFGGVIVLLAFLAVCHQNFLGGYPFGVQIIMGPLACIIVTLLPTGSNNSRRLSPCCRICSHKQDHKHKADSCYKCLLPTLSGVRPVTSLEVPPTSSATLCRQLARRDCINSPFPPSWRKIGSMSAVMQFQYFRPNETIRSLVGSYYNLTIINDLADVMRAEIANVRFIIRGNVHSDLGGTEVKVPAGSAVLCGPTFRWSNVRFEAGTVIFGAAITPLGWSRMLKVSAETYADKLVPLDNLVDSNNRDQIRAVTQAPDAESRVVAANHLFGSLNDPEISVNERFLMQATRWIVDPEPNELDDLLSATDLSARQIERLCKIYFGSAPKRLHRKFRALHSANRLTWKQLTDWRDIATTAYFDQSHFIREFRQFNGRTPSEFIKGAHLLVRMTLQERLQIDHESPFSLVG